MNPSKSKDEKNDRSTSTSTMKSIETIRDLFMKQTMFGKYFLRCLGVDVEDDIGPSYKQLSLRLYDVPTATDICLKNCDSGELFVSLNGLRGLALNDVSNNNAIFAEKILSAAIRLIDTKMVITDDLLVLCWEYVKTRKSNQTLDWKQKSSNDNDENKDNDNNNDGSSNRFLKSLLNCVSDCLSGESEYSARSYLYFKSFLLDSNIWYAKDTKNNKLLFNYVDELANKFLMKQKLFVKENIENEEKKDSENWDKLCKYNRYNYSGKQLRQDEIANGIVSLKSIKELYIISADNWNPNYDISSEYNDKVYVTQCLVFAQENSQYFQDEMKKLFKNAKIAPVKTYDRCVMKSS